MAQRFISDNMQFFGLALGALLGYMLMKNNSGNISDTVKAKLPASNAQRNANIIGAVVVGLLGYFIGSYVKGGGDQFFAHTYDTYDKLLPDDYYGVSGGVRNPTQIQFSNNPPSA